MVFKRVNSKITEKRNPNSINMDQLETAEILAMINRLDAGVAEAVKREIPVISKVVDKIVKGIKKGGRIFYVGAGTSGRMGVLDAVECIPTFSVEQGLVVGILAGGEKAMFVSQEDIEDNWEKGSAELAKYNPGEFDSVIGIAASGDTPFVLGAIDEASRQGAFTASITCNNNTKLEEKTEIAIVPIVGPEILTGSTRMKAGTAQKMVLNMISTTVMVKLGKVYSNLMVDLQPTNEKLRERTRNIFIMITESSHQQANDYLRKANYSLKPAIVMYKRKCSLEEAEELIKEHQGVLRKIIG